MTASVLPVPTERRSLHEDVTYAPGAYQVDRDQGIIRNLKVLGWKSRNGRRYLREAVEASLYLYEGCPVNINHPERPGVTRDSEDRFGRLRRPRIQDDGLYADLEYLKSHPMAERICEAAERMPEIFGLSHNSEGSTRLEAGESVVVSIDEVRSVDVVTQPATTNGLFEGTKVTTAVTTVATTTATPLAKKSLKSLFEAQIKKYDGAKRQRIKQLFEMGYEDELPMDKEVEPAEAGQGGDDVKTHLLAAMSTLLDSEDEDSLGKVDAIMKILKPEPKKEAEGDGDGNGDEDKDKDGMESVKAKLRRLERKDESRDLCEAAGVIPSPILLKSLMALEDAADRKALLEEHKTIQKPAAASGNGTTPAVASPIRSQSASGPLTESANNALPKFTNDDDGRAKRLAFLRGNVRVN